jgi:hypothetical protein
MLWDLLSFPRKCVGCRCHITITIIEFTILFEMSSYSVGCCEFVDLVGKGR